MQTLKYEIATDSKNVLARRNLQYTSMRQCINTVVEYHIVILCLMSIRSSAVCVMLVLCDILACVFLIKVEGMHNPYLKHKSACELCS